MTASPLACSLRDLSISKSSAIKNAMIWIAELDGRGRLRKLQRISLAAYGRGTSGIGLRTLASLDPLTTLDNEGWSGPGGMSEVLTG